MVKSHGQFSLGPKRCRFIRLIGYMVNRLCGLFWLDKTVDHISDMQCTWYTMLYDSVLFRSVRYLIFQKSYEIRISYISCPHPISPHLPLNAVSCSFLRASSSMTEVMSRTTPAMTEKTLDMISRLRTEIGRAKFYSIFAKSL